MQDAITEPVTQVLSPKNVVVPVSNLARLTAKLDIQIRVPAKLLNPDVLRAISGKLDLRVTLIYSDKSQPLSVIQQGRSPCMTKRHVILNSHGFVLNGNRHQKWNLFDHCFHDKLPEGIDGLDAANREYVVEIELIEPWSKVIYLLRYLTLSRLTSVSYPQMYVAIMQHLRSKNRPLQMFDNQGV